MPRLIFSNFQGLFFFSASKWFIQAKIADFDFKPGWVLETFFYAPCYARHVHPVSCRAVKVVLGAYFLRMEWLFLSPHKLATFRACRGPPTKCHQFVGRIITNSIWRWDPKYAFWHLPKPSVTLPWWLATLIVGSTFAGQAYPSRQHLGKDQRITVGVNRVNYADSRLPQFLHRSNK